MLQKICHSWLHSIMMESQTAEDAAHVGPVTTTYGQHSGNIALVVRLVE